MIFGFSHVNLNTCSVSVCPVPLGSAAWCGVWTFILGRWGCQLYCALVLWLRGELSALDNLGLLLLIEHASITSLIISALAVPFLVVQAGLKTPKLKWYYQLSLSRSWDLRCTPDALSLSRSSEGSPCLSDSSLMSSLWMGLSWAYIGPVSMMSSYFTFLLVLLLFMYFWVIPIRVHSFQKQDKPLSVFSATISPELGIIPSPNRVSSLEVFVEWINKSAPLSVRCPVK